MKLKKLRDSQGRECYGVSCEDVERQRKFAEESEGDDLQKSAPAVSTESLEDLKRSINRQFDELTELVAKLVKQRMSFHPQQTGEHLPAGVHGIPVRKDVGDNAARDPANIRKVTGAFGQDLQDSGKNRFVPQGVREIDAQNAEAIDLLKTARANGTPIR